MQRTRVFLVASLVAASLALTSAAQASGRAPQGGGLQWLSDDYHLSNISCTDGDGRSYQDLRNTRGGGSAAWAVGDTDYLYVLQSMSGDFTATYPDGSEESYSFAKTYGNKIGRADTLDCQADFFHNHDGVATGGLMALTLVRVW